MKKQFAFLPVLFLMAVLAAGMGKSNVYAKQAENLSESQIQISRGSVKLEESVFAYTGKAQKAKVTVTCQKRQLKNNIDYKVAYKNNKNIGIATVTVTGIGSYQGKVQKSFRIVPAAPTVLNAFDNEKGIKLNWVKDTRVDGYKIYRKEKGGEWKRIKTVKKSSKTSFWDTSAAGNGKTYCYRVRAYKKVETKTFYSDYSESISRQIRSDRNYLITSVLPKSETELTITWKKVSGVDGYIVCRKKDGKWKEIKTIPGAGTVQYTDAGLQYGQKYTYTVKTYQKSGNKKKTGSFDQTGYSAKLAWTSKYVKGYKLFYDAAGKWIKDVDGIIGKQSSYYLKVNKQCNTLTIYAKDGEKGYTIPVKAFVTSCGNGTPTGTFYTPAKYRWHTLSHGVQGQWCTRIKPRILFHSVWYSSRNNKDLSVKEYNRLGTLASAGCVRLSCEGAKWIYDNCSLKTKVTIYNDSDCGPLGKPTADKLPSWHTWDPTDPNLRELCQKKGCH